MATEQTITISGTPTEVSDKITVPYVKSSDLEVYIGQGKVEKVILDNAGAGYADATNAALEFSGGGGSSAALTVDVADGQVSLDNAGVPTNKGSGYTTAPIVGFGNISGGTAAAATAEIFTKKTVTTDYSVSGTSGSATLTFTSALSNGDKVLIKRVTDVSTAANTFNAGSAITAADLNNSFNQLRYKAEELPNVTTTALTNGDKNEITVSGDNWTIDNGVVTSAKLGTNIDIAGTLDVTSAGTFDNNVTIAGTLASTGNFSINTNKFNVAGSDGDTTIAGTLGVTGATTLTGALDANGGASIDNIQIGVTGDNEIDTSSGNLTIDSAGGTVAIDDNATVSGTLGVTSNTTVGGTLGITGTTTAAAINASGAVGIDGDLDVNTNKLTVASATGNTAIAGTLGITGNTTLGPLILSKTSKDVTGLTTLALHASDNTGNNIINATYLNLYSSSGAVSIASITGGVAGQILVILGSGDGTSGTSTNDITLTDTPYEGGTANGFVSGRALDVSTGAADVFIYNGAKWINLTVGNN